MSEYQDSPGSSAWTTQDSDCDLSSFIDALWDQQIADGTFDLGVQDKQEAQDSLASFGDLHVISPDIASASTEIDATTCDSTPGDHGTYGFSNDTGFHVDPSADMTSQPWFEERRHVYEDNNLCSSLYLLQQSLPASFDSTSPYDNHSTHQASSPCGSSPGLDGYDINEPCYARLLYNCLRETPNHTLSLRDIYGWIKTHTQKARDPKNKGWQNSVRHNLSMNAAFERVHVMAGNGETKKGSLWRLTPEAMQNGVISTTRYRRDPKRKAIRRGAPAPQRQLSGAKGGAATRAASQARRQIEVQERLVRAAHARAQQQLFTSAPAPQHMPRYQPTARSSPYFVSSVDTSPTTMHQLYNTYHTPSTVQLGYDDPQKTFLKDLQLHSLDYNQGLLGPVSGLREDTPSQQTESSYFTDEPMCIQSDDQTMLGL